MVLTRVAMAKVEPELLSIGDICSETGLSADVVRVWERRYGFPVPVRLPSGHRRYRQADLHQLRLMAEAVAQGHRPSMVARAGEAALKRLLIPMDNPGVEALFQAVVAMDTEPDAPAPEGIARSSGLEALPSVHRHPASGPGGHGLGRWQHRHST